MIEKGNIHCDQYYYCMKKPRILLIPYPAQGHVTPMLKLGSALLSQGFEPVIVIPEFIHRRIIPSLNQNDRISCVSIPDGLDEDEPHDFFGIEKAMENTMPIHLERIFHEDDGRVVCLIVDLLASWAIQVADRCGVPPVGFWPAMLATYRLIAAIPDMLRTSLISDTGCPQHDIDTSCFLPNQSMLSTEHLPWLIGTSSARTARFKFWRRTLDRSRTLRWLLVNSFDPEEIIPNIDQNQLLAINKIHDPLIFPIGPLSKHAASSVTIKNPSFWEEDMSCIDWLDKQKPNSVIYISFGSWVSPIGESKLRNLALSLEETGKPFIWVLGLNWRHGLPNGYLERFSKLQDGKKGKVVSWAPQMEVLQHKAVGFYLTHCGWNSTMEAIQCKKPLLCYPIAGDQFVNCSYIVKVWRIGVQINGFGLEDIEQGLRKVMEDSEMKNRLLKLSERTMGEEASYRVMAILTAFIDDLKKQTNDQSLH